MSRAASWTDPGTDLIALMDAARTATDALLSDAIVTVRERVCAGGRPDAQLMEREQRATHGLAWFATYTLASIFEGAAEIQAHVIARRLLEGGN